MIFLRFVYFIVEKISIKFDIHKLKRFIDLEFIIVEKIVSKLNHMLPYYLDFYKKMLDNELEAVNISKEDKILHIGCGPIPATAILISNKTKAQVIGIDNNLKSVNQALKCISNQLFSEKIQIIHADALDFPVENFDLIIISQGVKPCEQILKNISKKMKKTCNVIYRTSSLRNGNLAKNDFFIKDLFSLKKIIHQEKNGLLVSVLINTK